jgi:hypothetical protein
MAATRSLASGSGLVQTHLMPLPALIAVTLVSIGSAAFIVSGVKTLRRRKRNLLHYERDEPLEGAGDWD